MTTPGLRPLIAGNWKMNGTRAALREVVVIRRGARNAELAVFPPATLLHEAATILEGSEVALGAQDCHPEPAGPFTGDLSAPMLKDAGCAYVILGHSERRAGHWESDAMVKAKAEAAQRAGLTPIVCVGETRSQRAAGEAVAVVSRQVRGSLPPGPAIIAYEPVWAIGTGLIPTRAEVAEMHGVLRGLSVELAGPGAAKMRLLYGGSVKPGNARDLLALEDVDGALVGGASLHALEFLAIAAALD